MLVIVNQGRTAGASLEHPHSQVFATAGRPTGSRPSWTGWPAPPAACATVAAERDGPRLVGATGELLAICPWASAFPFETLLLPAAHRPRFEEGGTDDDTAMATALGDLLAGSAGWPATTPHNLVLHSAPPGSTTSTGTCTCCPA